MKIYAAMRYYSYEGARPIGHFLSEENAVKCCEEAYQEAANEALKQYGPGSEMYRRFESDSLARLWTQPMVWKNNCLSQNDDAHSNNFFVRCIEVKP